MPRISHPVTPALRARLRALKHLALDLDGTLYRGQRLFPATLPFLQTLRDLGIGCTYLTNNSSLSRRDYLKKMRALGLPVTLAQIQTSTDITVENLHARRPRIKTLLVLGTQSLRNELKQAGFRLINPDAGRVMGRRDPDAVIVAFDQTLTYDRLCLASAWIAQGKPFFATHLDLTCPSDPSTVLIDCGAICRAITAATGVEPVAFGKPNPAILYSLCRQHGLRPRELGMVGDRLYTDIAMANRAGSLSILVLSGETTRAAAQQNATHPGCIFPDIGALGEALLAARSA